MCQGKSKSDKNLLRDEKREGGGAAYPRFCMRGTLDELGMNLVEAWAMHVWVRWGGGGMLRMPGCKISYILLLIDIYAVHIYLCF